MKTHIITCPWCNGSGSFRLHYSLALELCPTCEGKGLIDLAEPVNNTVPHKLTVKQVTHAD